MQRGKNEQLKMRSTEKKLLCVESKQDTSAKEFNYVSTR